MSAAIRWTGDHVEVTCTTCLQVIADGQILAVETVAAMAVEHHARQHPAEPQEPSGFPCNVRCGLR